jgi:hypothetical protein
MNLNFYITKLRYAANELRRAEQVLGPEYDQAHYADLRWTISDLQALQEKWEKRMGLKKAG